jgi:hypothetical protein
MRKEDYWKLMAIKKRYKNKALKALRALRDKHSKGACNGGALGCLVYGLSNCSSNK